MIEAKKRAIEPYVAKNQALPYAQQLQAPFIFLSKGELIYFWDYQNDDARIVNSFFSRRQVKDWFEQNLSQGFEGIIYSYDEHVEKGHHPACRVRTGHAPQNL